MYAPRVSLELPQPGQRIGRYRVESLLGEGGMGAVFAATNDVTGRAVAIKWMLPSVARSDEAVARFLAEARATARIEHPNVIQVLDMGQDGLAPFLVMERLRGESLGERLARVGRMSSAETLALMIPACRGIAEAHSEGIIHRDLKPDNIFLCEGKDGSPRPPKVLDFGISKLYEEGDTKKLTQTGSIMGTPLYMSPEQVTAHLAPDAAFDVYSMGVVLYECLAGRAPFESDGIFGLLQKISAGDATPLRVAAPDVAPEIAEVVMRAMHINREYRYSSMTALADELERVRAYASAAPPISTATRVDQVRGPATGPLVAPTSSGHPATSHGNHAAFSHGSHPQTAHANHPQTAHASHPPTALGGQPPTAFSTPPSTPPDAALPTQPPDRTGLIILSMAVGLMVILLAVGVGVAVAVKHMTNAPPDPSYVPMGDDTPGDPNTGAPPNAEGLEVDLQFEGTCAPRFQGRTMVNSSNGNLSITSFENSALSGSLSLSFSEGAIAAGVATFSTRGVLDAPETRVHVMHDGKVWLNMSKDGSQVLAGTSPDPIAGQVRIRRFDADAAISDVTFEHVVLQNADDGSLCTIDGTLRTNGPQAAF